MWGYSPSLTPHLPRGQVMHHCSAHCPPPRLQLIGAEGTPGSKPVTQIASLENLNQVLQTWKVCFLGLGDCPPFLMHTQ